MTTVVCVHGAAMDGTTWRFQAEALTRTGFSPRAVDLPGHGESEGDASTTIKGYAGWLLAYLATIDESVHFVGHSMGALIVLEAAAARPDRVKTITLLGISDKMPVNPSLLAATEAEDRTVFATMGRWMHGRAPATEGGWGVADTVAVIDRSRPGVAYADLTACNDHPGAAEIAARLSIPMLLILGSDDVMTKPSAAEPIAAAAEAETVVIEGAGHMALVERPAAVNDALIGFIADHDLP